MTGSPLCPRCGQSVLPPSAMSGDWRCDEHGVVAPLKLPSTWGREWLTSVVTESTVPLWLPWPLPAGWVVTGAVLASDPRAAGAGAAVLLSGPSARSGPADLVLVAEEPGTGLGGGYAGLRGTDPGPAGFAGPPSARVLAGQHETPLWEVKSSPDRSAYLGEAAGCWLWAVAWPMETVLVLHDSVTLVDMREAGPPLDVPLGAPSPRARPRGTSQ